MSDSSTLTLLPHQARALRPGRYRLRVSQQVVSTQEGALFEEKAESAYRLVVQGERFKLDGGAIHSLYPPENSLGEFSRHLPHVVLRKPAFPWERRPGGAAGETAPWLAVLLLHEGELRPLPEPRQATLAELEAPAPKGVFFPPFQRDADGEAAQDPCFVVELPRALFNAVAPRPRDLPYLGHVRRVGLADKALAHDAPGGGLFGPGPGEEKGPSEQRLSVLIGNRFGVAAPSPANDEQPLRAGHRNRAYLVSLENYGPFLPGGERNGELERYETVRLSCLRSWEFGVIEKPRGLQEVLGALDHEPGHLQLSAGKDPADPAERRVDQAFSMGYVALGHHTRRDDRTVSWYRGPLLPYAMEALPGLRRVRAADKALHYDPDTGLFDVSYAAAWQLGRLLALNNMGFAKALMEWRNGKIHQTRAWLDWQRLSGELGLSLRPLAGCAAQAEAEGTFGLIADHLADGLESFLRAFRAAGPGAGEEER